MAALPGVFARNWKLKLAAIALSGILWVFVASEETTTQLVTVPIEIELPPGLALAKPAPSVRVLATGPGRELIKLYGSPPSVRVRVPATATASRWRFSLEPGDIQVPRNIRVAIQDVEPRAQALDLDRLVERDVPIALRGVVEAESGYAIAGRPAFTPASARVSGPRALVYALDSVPVEPVEIRGVVGEFQRTAVIDTAGRPLLRFTPREVLVRGRAARRT